MNNDDIVKAFDNGVSWPPYQESCKAMNTRWSARRWLLALALHNPAVPMPFVYDSVNETTCLAWTGGQPHSLRELHLQIDIIYSHDGDGATQHNTYHNSYKEQVTYFKSLNTRHLESGTLTSIADFDALWRWYTEPLEPVEPETDTAKPEPDASQQAQEAPMATMAMQLIRQRFDKLWIRAQRMNPAPITERLVEDAKSWLLDRLNEIPDLEVPAIQFTAGGAICLIWWGEAWDKKRLELYITPFYWQNERAEEIVKQLLSDGRSSERIQITYKKVEHEYPFSACVRVADGKVSANSNESFKELYTWIYSQPGPPPTRLDYKLNYKLAEITDLAHGEFYQAGQDAIESATEFLKRIYNEHPKILEPNVSALPDGDISMIWRSAGYKELTIYVGDDGEITYLREKFAQIWPYEPEYKRVQDDEYADSGDIHTLGDFNRLYHWLFLPDITTPAQAVAWCQRQHCQVSFGHDTVQIFANGDNDERELGSGETLVQAVRRAIAEYYHRASHRAGKAQVA